MSRPPSRLPRISFPKTRQGNGVTAGGALKDPERCDFLASSIVFLVEGRTTTLRR